MLHQDRQRAESFGADAEQYHRSRPRYPPELVDALWTPSVGEVLDVGCGTGIAGSLLQERGCRVLGVEPDVRMARVAEARGLPVETSTFETWDPAGLRFDLVVCGQAWHWVDPRQGSLKAADILRDGGTLGIFWNVGQPSDDLRAALGAVYARHEPDLERYSVLLGHVDDRLETTASTLDATGRFTPATCQSWRWTQPYTTSEWLDHLVTHSDHRTLPPDRRTRLFDALHARIEQLGGTIDMTYETRLITAKRR